MADKICNVTHFAPFSAYFRLKNVNSFTLQDTRYGCNDEMSAISDRKLDDMDVDDAGGIVEESEEFLMRPMEVTQFDKDPTHSEVFCTAHFIYSKFITGTEYRRSQ